MLDVNYLAGFPNTVEQVFVVIFEEPVMVAGVHAGALFGPDQIASAAFAGLAADFRQIEALAALCFLELVNLQENTSVLQRLFDKSTRWRLRDLKKLHQGTFELIEEDVRGGSKRLRVFIDSFVDDLQKHALKNT